MCCKDLAIHSLKSVWFEWSLQFFWWDHLMYFLGFRYCNKLLVVQSYKFIEGFAENVKLLKFGLKIICQNWLNKNIIFADSFQELFRILLHNIWILLTQQHELFVFWEYQWEQVVFWWHWRVKRSFFHLFLLNHRYFRCFLKCVVP